MQSRIQPKDLEIGQRIRAQRKLKKMSQTDLANKIGVTFQQVQKYENGSNRVGGGRLHAIATALGVAPSFLFGESGGGSFDYETDAMFRMLNRSDSVRLIKAFDKLKGRNLRVAILAVVERAASKA
jgi:transcriptional regulator with XRE-family HTH domain